MNISNLARQIAADPFFGFPPGCMTIEGVGKGHCINGASFDAAFVRPLNRYTREVVLSGIDGTGAPFTVTEIVEFSPSDVGKDAYDHAH